MIGIIVPNSIVADADISKLYNTCYIYSGYIVASIDIPDNNFSQFVRNTFVLESIFTHLFEVMIIGRLLSKVKIAATIIILITYPYTLYIQVLKTSLAD